MEIRRAALLVYAAYSLQYVMSASHPALRVVAIFTMGLPALLALIQTVGSKESDPVFYGWR